jgi:hypothetical protein
MDVMQWGRMFCVWVQHHDKMVMTADVSSAKLIKSDSKVLQNVSTLYHFNTMLYPKTPQVTQIATDSVLLWDSCQQMGTTVWILTQLHITISLVQSCWAAQMTNVNLASSLPCLVLLIHFSPYPLLDSTALNDGLLVNNEFQRKWLSLIWGIILQLSKTKKHLPRNSTSLWWDCVWEL